MKPTSQLTSVGAALGRLTTIKTSALPGRGGANAVDKPLSETDSSPMTSRGELPSLRVGVDATAGQHGEHEFHAKIRTPLRGSPISRGREIYPH